MDATVATVFGETEPEKKPTLVETSAEAIVALLLLLHPSHAVSDSVASSQVTSAFLLEADVDATVATVSGETEPEKKPMLVETSAEEALVALVLFFSFT